MNGQNGIIIIVIYLYFVAIVNAEVNDRNDTHITYVANVDPDLGFYKVIDNTLHKSVSYMNRTLIINQGDTVIWKNDIDSSSSANSTSVTIVNEQGLFKDIYLKLVNDISGYVFNQPGKYTFYIKERQTARQTIIVNGTSDPEVTYVATPTVTPVVTQTTVIPTPNPTIINITHNSSTNSTNLSTNSSVSSKNSSTNISNIVNNRIDIDYILNDYIEDLLVIATISVIGYIVICLKFRSKEGIKYGTTVNNYRIAHELRCKRFSTKVINIYNADEYNRMYFTVYTRMTEKGVLVKDENYINYKLDTKANKKIIYTHEQNISFIKVEVKSCENDKHANYKIEYIETMIPIIIR